MKFKGPLRRALARGNLAGCGNESEIACVCFGRAVFVLLFSFFCAGRPKFAADFRSWQKRRRCRCSGRRAMSEVASDCNAEQHRLIPLVRGCCGRRRLCCKVSLLASCWLGCPSRELKFGAEYKRPRLSGRNVRVEAAEPSRNVTQLATLRETRGFKSSELSPEPFVKGSADILKLDICR